MVERRALLVGVGVYLDEGLPRRREIAAAIRRIHTALEVRGWSVQILIDDASSDSARPLRSNVLDRLSWLSEGEERLLVLSGAFRNQRFMPRDAMTSHTDETSIGLETLQASLNADSGAVIDGVGFPGVWENCRWSLVFDGEVVVEPTSSSGFGSPFLNAVASGFSGSLSDEELTSGTLYKKAKTESAGSSDGAKISWFGDESAPLGLVSLERRRCHACEGVLAALDASFCPHCGVASHVSEFIADGRYQLLKPLGQGGMGAVFLAHDSVLGVSRALKLLTVPAGLDEAIVETVRNRMIREARAAQQLAARTHHVVHVFDVGFSQERGQPFLVMELLEGETLGARLARGSIPMAIAASIARQMAETLVCAHGQGIWHRDLKPENIMLVDRDGCSNFVKLLDFGLVKMETAEPLTRTGTALGTVQYMAPEQLRGRPTDGRADIFSLGAVLFECFTGRAAIPGPTQEEIFATLLDRGVDSITTVVQDLPQELATLIDGCLALDMNQRPQTMDEVAEVLRRYDTAQHGETEPPSIQSHPVDSMSRPASTHPVAPSREPPISIVGGEVSGPHAAADVRPIRPLRWLVVIGVLAAGGFVVQNQIWNGEEDGVRTRAVLHVDAGAPATRFEKKTEEVVEAVAAPVAEDSTPTAFTPSVGWTNHHRPSATVVRDTDYVYYGAENSDEAYAALVRDLNLPIEEGESGTPGAGSDGNHAAGRRVTRWGQASPSLRRWLARPIKTEDLINTPRGLRIGLNTLARLKKNRPQTHALRRLGTVLVRPGEDPVFEKVRCGKGLGGDVLTAAKWQLRGHDSGQCDGTRCVRRLVGVLRKAYSVGERLGLKLTVLRTVEESDAESKMDLACRLRP
jgi:serine/threonine-protein kinase